LEVYGDEQAVALGNGVPTLGTPLPKRRDTSQ